MAEAIIVTKFTMDDGVENVGLLPIQLSFRSEKDLFDWLNRLPYAAEIKSVSGLVEDNKVFDVADLQDEATVRESPTHAEYVGAQKRMERDALLIERYEDTTRDPWADEA